MRVKGDGPRQTGKRAWVMNYTFKLYVMQIRIQARAMRPQDVLPPEPGALPGPPLRAAWGG